MAVQRVQPVSSRIASSLRSLRSLSLRLSSTRRPSCPGDSRESCSRTSTCGGRRRPGRRAFSPPRSFATPTWVVVPSLSFPSFVIDAYGPLTARISDKKKTPCWSGPLVQAPARSCYVFLFFGSSLAATHGRGDRRGAPCACCGRVRSAYWAASQRWGCWWIGWATHPRSSGVCFSCPSFLFYFVSFRPACQLVAQGGGGPRAYHGRQSVEDRELPL